MTWLRGVPLKKARNMTEESLFPEDLLAVMRRFDQQTLPEIQTAFAAAAAGTTKQEKQLFLEYLSTCAERAKTNNDPDALGSLAAVFGDSNHFDVAIPLLEKACEIDTDQPLSFRLTTRFKLGYYYSQTERFPEALATYEQVIEIWKNELETRSFSDYLEDHISNFQLYNVLLHTVRTGIFHAAGTIELNFLDAGDQAAAEPYLDKAKEYEKYLLRPTETPAADGPTLRLN
jgi:tetratricopeptide (TPR) repeat protein